MPIEEQPHEEWRRLVQDWRSVWDPWGEAIDKIAEASSRGESPKPAAYDLVEQLAEQVKAAEAPMDEFRRKLLQRSRQRWSS